MTRQTRLKVLAQGSVQMAHDIGYMVVGNNDAVCFYIDTVRPSIVLGGAESETGCPVINLIDGADNEMPTMIEFSEFHDWRFHSGSNGKCIAIALVRNGAGM